MRLLVVSQYYWPENFIIDQLCETLSKKGVNVTVLTGKPNYPEGRIYSGYRFWGVSRESRNGVNLIRVPIFPRGERSAIGLVSNYLSFVLFAAFFAPIYLRREKFDCVFVFAPSPILQALPAIFLSWVKRASLSIWVQDLWPDVLQATGYIKSPRIINAVGRLVKYIYSKSDSILIQSRAFKSSVVAYGADEKKIFYFPNSLLDCCPNSSEQDSAYGEREEIPDISGFSVVFAGNIGSAQRCDVIVDAAERLRDHKAIKFYLVGSGSEASSISYLIAEKRLKNIEMLGRYPSSTMPALYAKCSVLILSLADHESLSTTIPSKLQTYLAAGKPVVVCANGEAASVAREAGAGLTCAAEDSSALADAILRLYEMPPHELAELGNNGRSYFERNFDMSTRADELIQHLEGLSSLESISL